MTLEARAAEGPPGPLPYAAALALVLLLHLFFLFSGMTPVLDGLLPGGDSYMRLLRVTHLYETGVWTDGTLPRSNWPYGESQNWTRPPLVRRTAIEGDPPQRACRRIKFSVFLGLEHPPPLLTWTC